MIDAGTADRLAQEWIEAWNQRDLDAIMRHYADDVEFWSPAIVRRMGIANGKIEGKAQLRAYFARGLEAQPDLHFSLLQVLRGVDSITLHYRRHDGTESVEVMALDEQHQVVMGRVHYSPTNPVWRG